MVAQSLQPDHPPPPSRLVFLLNYCSYRRRFVRDEQREVRAVATRWRWRPIESEWWFTLCWHTKAIFSARTHSFYIYLAGFVMGAVMTDKKKEREIKVQDTKVSERSSQITDVGRLTNWSSNTGAKDQSPTHPPPQHIHTN